jgi:hypothetical protein
MTNWADVVDHVVAVAYLLGLAWILANRKRGEK